MNTVEVGQVLSLKIRFNNTGDVSSFNHPYLIMSINPRYATIEIAQLDSLKGKEYKAAFKSNQVIYNDNPKETVIDEDSYVQMDNTIIIEMYSGLLKYRRQKDKLSLKKLTDVLLAYDKYHKTYAIDPNKQVYMSKQELESLQK